MADLKRCPCKDHEGPNPLPVTEFHRDRSKPGELAAYCKACAKRKARDWRQANPEAFLQYKADHPEILRAAQLRLDRDNAASRGTATHHGEPWTLAQLETAARDDLTARQIAALLGRTIFAVRNIRERMKDDGYVDLNQMRQSLIKDLASSAAGSGGNYDIFSQALDQQLAQGYASVLSTPVAIPRDQPDSDEPDPAG